MTGSPGTAILRLLGSDEGGQVSASQDVEECQEGCVAKRLTVSGGVGFQGNFFTLGSDNFQDSDGRRTTILRSLNLGDTELLDEDWALAGAENLSAEDKGVVERTDDGALRVTTATGTVRADSASVVQTTPVLATEGFAFGESGPVVSGRAATRAPPRSPPSCPACPSSGAWGCSATCRSRSTAAGPPSRPPR